ncbi:hypothetical protein [Lentzea sp. E54]|uniref:hypothetical protein n=1 Tax=Lentzea xerophila TaxID=3435883 RepID=UPI003DA3F413
MDHRLADVGNQQWRKISPEEAHLEPGTSADSVADRLRRYAESGVDEAYFDAFAMFTSLDHLLDFARRVIERTGRL